MMYNEKRKEQFLKERNEHKKLGRNTLIGFLKASRLEECYKKDLCEWTTKEIISFYKYLSTPRAQSLIVLNSCFRIYTDWCLNNGNVPDHQNHYAEITTFDICNCVNTNELKKLIVSRDELLYYISDLKNYSDQFIFLGIFEGLGLNSNILGNIRFDQVDYDKKVVYFDEKTIPISDDLVSIIKNSKDKEDGRIPVGKSVSRKTTSYIQTDTIIRQGERKNSQADLNKLIGYRFRACLNKMGLYKEITRKDISESGRIDLIKKMMKDENISLDEALSHQYRNDHEAIYGKIMNKEIYKNTYGKFI